MQDDFSINGSSREEIGFSEATGASGQLPFPKAHPSRANPYEINLHDSNGQEHPVTAELVDTNRPRTWTTFAVSALSLLSFLLVSGIMVGVAMFVVHGELNLRLLRSEAAMEEVSSSRVGLTLLVVIPQLALVLPACFAAILSPVKIRERLGLVRGHWPLWAWLAAALATPLVGLISSVVVGSFAEESENLKSMSEVFRIHGANGFLVPLALMIGATPAICEEILFRGYIQTRLNRAIGPAAGITLASLAFALFHMDIIHVIAVFPLGVFLGIVAWRSGSLVPAMLGHFVNNVISVVAVVMAPQNETDVLALPVAMLSLSIMGLGFFGALAVIAASIVYPIPNRNPPTGILVSSTPERESPWVSGSFESDHGSPPTNPSSENIT